MTESQINDRLFVGCYPTGLVYADRGRDERGDYKRLAFLPYDTLALEFSPGSEAFRAVIEACAAKVQAQRGGRFEVSACGQSVRLGS
jgi:hypothetical protein